MVWATSVGLLVLSTSFYALLALPESAVETVAQETIGITDRGAAIHHEAPGAHHSKLMRTDKAEVNAQDDESHPHHHQHHAEAKEHHHHTDVELDQKGFSGQTSAQSEQSMNDQEPQHKDAEEGAVAKDEDTVEHSDEHKLTHKHHKAQIDKFGEGELLEEKENFLPALGMNNPADLAYRAMDMVMGIASIIPEDFPFVCICLDSGNCDENLPEDKKQACPNRIGQKSSAVATPIGVAALLLAFVMGLHA